MLAVFGLLVALPVAGAGATRADNPVLTGDVGSGDSFTINLADSTGTRVKNLDPGTYTLVVHDHSSVHNFDLTGPGVSVATDVDAIGDKTFTITLSPGTYTYVCDAHVAQMKGTFTVGGVTTTRRRRRRHRLRSPPRRSCSRPSARARRSRSARPTARRSRVSL